MSGKKRKAQRGKIAIGVEPPRALFVCVRERDGKGASCAGSGARALLADMRSILADEGIGADELSLRPCGCLGLCKQGPVLVAAMGEAAREKKLPKLKKRLKKKISARVYTRVAQAEVRGVLRDAILHEPHTG